MSVNVITKDNFDAEVLKETKPVLLDFWASWCGPCRMVSPIIDEIANERADLKVGKVNVDEQPELAAKFGVMSIPTLIVMKDGKIEQIATPDVLFLNHNLVDIGLDVPFSANVARELRQNGLQIPEKYYTESELADFLWQSLLTK